MGRDLEAQEPREVQSVECRMQNGPSGRALFERRGQNEECRVERAERKLSPDKQNRDFDRRRNLV